MRKAFRSPANAFSAAALLALLALSSGVPNGALAEEAQAPKTEHATKQQDRLKSQETAPSRLPPTVVTSHTTTLDGQALHYSAVAGTVPLHEKGKTTAEIFYVAYAKEPKDTHRPVTFVFNGGPGAASAYLHLGAIGPRIVEATDNGELIGPPPRLVDNDASWLAFTDLVFVDPVGTRPSGEGRRWRTSMGTRLWIASNRASTTCTAKDASRLTNALPRQTEFFVFVDIQEVCR